MKLFISNARLLYTALLLTTLFVASFSPPATAQNPKPFTTKYESYSQMWSVSNTCTAGSSVYYNTPTSNNLGSQIDTVNAGYALIMGILGYNPDACVSCSDTFTYKILYGNGSIVITASCLATNTITTVALTPQQSMNGIDWVPITGLSTTSITSTSKTIPVVGTSTTTITIATKYGLYYRVSALGVTDAAAIRLSYHWQAPFTYYTQGN